jgi:hypothetical protein
MKVDKKNVVSIFANTIITTEQQKHFNLKKADEVIKNNLANALCFKLMQHIKDNLPTIKYATNNHPEGIEYVVKINLISNEMYFKLNRLDDEINKLENKNEISIKIIKNLQKEIEELKKENYELKRLIADE